MPNTTTFSLGDTDFILKNASSLLEVSLSPGGTSGSHGLDIVPVDSRDPLYIVVPITCLYALILLTGVVGNVSTCIVIARNKSMHTATNYYLFSLAVSDLLLLVSGLPPEMYRLWWPQVYIFGDTFCMVQSFSAETSANATVLTITAFTVERYIAICHPFLTHTMSKLSRAIKFVVAIWLVALCLAVPQAIQYGMYYAIDESGSPVSRCTMTRLLVEHAFELSTLVFFAGPMTAITVLYVLIALKLRGSRFLTAAGSIDEQHGAQRRRSAASQNRVIKMLVAVVVGFFVCWAPFHAQRLLAVYISHAFETQEPPGPVVITTYHVLDYVSGVLYFLSTTVNPLLYNIMSNKFRDAFKSKKHSPSSLWVYYSMLRSTIGINKNIDIKSFQKLYAFVKRQNVGNEVKKAKVLCDDEFKKFLIKAEDEEYLLAKSTLAAVQSCGRNHAHSPRMRTYSTLSRYQTSIRHHPHLIQDDTAPGHPADRARTTQPSVDTLIQLQNSNHPFRHPVSKIAENGRISRQFRPRCNSNSSQTTVLTSLSRSVHNSDNTRTNVKNMRVPRRKIPSKGSAMSFGALAQRLRILGLFRPEELNVEKQFVRHKSVDSGNTISDSSLQDLDEMEFSSSDLVKYMEEVNHDLT